MTTGRRIYASPVRDEQAARTRTRILAAFAEQLDRPGTTDISVTEAAKRAGVAVRTVYHYFPDRDARLRGLAQWIDRQLQPATLLPQEPDDLPQLARSAYRAVQRNETLLRAQMATGFTAEVRATRRRERTAAIHRVVASVGAPPEQSHRAAALIAHLISADTALPLMDVHGLSLEEASAVVVRAVETIVADLRAHVPSTGSRSELRSPS